MALCTVVRIDAAKDIYGFQGESSFMADSKSCQHTGCSRPAVTFFRNETLCIEHFCTRCYELLEPIDQRSSNGLSREFTAEHAILADECARRAIDVCLSANAPNNMDRARLLDIVLWCGDISTSFRVKKNAIPSDGFRAPYQKPQARRIDAKAAFPE